MGGEPHRLTWKEVELRKAFKKRCVRLWTSVVNQENFTNRREDTFPPTRKMAAPLLDSLSEYLGSPEPAVRLIFSILIGEFLFTDLLLAIVVFRRHDFQPWNSAQPPCL